MVIDTHTHLYLKEFAADIDDVINRAKNLKINNFFLPAIDSSYTRVYDCFKKRISRYNAPHGRLTSM